MDLRPALLPPPVPAERLAELSARITAISDLLDRGEPASAEITAFNALTGHSYGPEAFADYWNSRSLEDLALEAARPAHPRVADITRDELAEIVDRLLRGDPESGYYLRLLSANVIHPRAGDLIFYPPPELDGASAAEIVDAMLSYRPIAL